MTVLGLLAFLEREQGMHTGKIKKVIRERGFGFISDTDGKEIFFHRSNLVDTDFETLAVDQEVEFEVERTPKGPSAINIRPI
jgi:CspA family cold shock protein